MVPRAADRSEAWNRHDAREGPEEIAGSPIIRVRYGDVAGNQLRSFASSLWSASGCPRKAGRGRTPEG